MWSLQPFFTLALSATTPPSATRGNIMLLIHTYIPLFEQDPAVPEVVHRDGGHVDLRGDFFRRRFLRQMVSYVVGESERETKVKCVQEGRPE